MLNPKLEELQIGDTFTLPIYLGGIDNYEESFYTVTAAQHISMLCNKSDRFLTLENNALKESGLYSKELKWYSEVLAKQNAIK